MILVTVGTTIYQFDRLIKEMDELIGKKKIKEKVIMQTAYSKYKPKNCESHDFIKFEEMDELNRKADVIISHAGSGCILMALKYGKPLVLVPRLKQFGEHESDHQLQMVKSLEKQGKAVGVYDIKNLGDAIEKAKKMKTKKRETDNTIIKEVAEYLKENAKGKKICAIANAGGHFTQLVPLIPELSKYNTFYVVAPKTTHLTKTLKGKRYYWMANPKFNPFSYLWATVKLLIKERPRVIVTTGAGCAIAISILSKLFLRSKIVFIECFSRSEEPTVTGKILYRFSNLFYVQWKELLKHYGKKARFRGVVY